MIDSLDTGLTLHGTWWWLLFWPPVLWFVRHTYQQTRPPISTAALLWLQLLRSLAFSMLLALLIAPILIYVLKQAEYPLVVTLIDNSQSMTIREAGTSRRQAVADSMSGGLGLALQRSVVGIFSDHPVRSTWSNVLGTPTSGQATNIGSALEQAPRWGTERQRLHAAVIISDGRHNLGDHPVAAAQELGVPIYALGVGSAIPPDDVQLVSVEPPGPMLSGHPAVLRIFLRQWGFTGRRAQIDVSLQDSVVASEVRWFADPGVLEQVDIPLPPMPAGLQSLSIRVASMEGEVTHQNNVATTLVQVRPHRLNVLAVTGGASPDFAFLHRTLAADSSLTIQFFTHERGWIDNVDLSDLDVLILHDLSRQQFGAETARRVEEFVQTGGGLLFLAGDRQANSGGVASSGLPLLVPTRPLKSASGPPVIGQHGQHPAIRHTDDTGSDWSRLPPLLGMASALERPAEGPVLLSVDSTPVAMAVTHGQGRLITTVGSGFWRLDLLASGVGETPQTIRRFWRQSVQWLGLPEATRKVRSTPEQAVVKHGQAAQLQIEVFDELMQPFSNADFNFTLNGEIHRPTIQRLGAGRYLASWPNLVPGSYSYELSATSQDVVLGDDRGEFSVAVQTLEMSDQRLDEEMLQQIAQATGGAYRSLARWPELAEKLSPPPSLDRETKHAAIEVAQSWWLFLIIGGLSIEWILRKRWGLL